MQAFEAARAERRARPRLIRPAEPDRAPRRATAMGFGARALGLARGLAATLAEGRRRRRARPRLETWMAMDPRVLADIGVRRADVLGALYGGVPVAQLAARGQGEPPAGERLRQPCHPAPRLRLLAADDLDAAA